MSTTKVLGAELGGGQTDEGIGHEASAKDVTTVDIPAGGDVDTDDLGTIELIGVLSKALVPSKCLDGTITTHFSVEKSSNFFRSSE